MKKDDKRNKRKSKMNKRIKNEFKNLRFTSKNKYYFIELDLKTRSEEKKRRK